MTDKPETESSAIKQAHSQTENILSGESATLDLNLIKRALGLALEETETHTEALILKNDLALKVHGMLRAVSVAHDNDGIELEEVEQLIALPATELIKRYRTAGARFRDTFPGNLSYIRNTKSGARATDWSDYRSY